MRLMNRSWGTLGLVLLLVGSLMVPVVAQALPRGGDNLLGGYEDTETREMEVVGDPNDGSGNRPQAAPLGGSTPWHFVLEAWVRTNIDRRVLVRLGFDRWLRNETALGARR